MKKAYMKPCVRCAHRQLASEGACGLRHACGKLVQKFH